MGGGLMQLVAYGAQDVYLTGNPQITFFKTVYKRHTNFSMEHIQQTFKGNPGAGARVIATISRNGDLVHDCYLKAVCKGDSVTHNPGHAIIDNIECQIGGQLIDRQYGQWMETHAELTEKGVNNETTVLDAMKVGSQNAAQKNPTTFQLTAGAGGVYSASFSDTNLYVPLRFWFNRHVGLSLPLIALQYHEVNIIVKFTSQADATKFTPIELWANYIYLDTDERRRFAQVSHEYLIEQVQLQEFSKASATTSYSYKLNFNHPVKELIWIQSLLEWGSDGSTSNSVGSVPSLLYKNTTTAQLKLNGHDRFAAQTIDYFTRYQVLKYHSTSCAKSSYIDAIAVYSFALKPEEHQPSGTCNFSRIDSAQLLFENFVTGFNQTIYVYAVNYNVLRIMSGMGGLAYSN